ncbi:MAG: hypothetical protein P8R04_03915, partial [Gammaproteobacteria bacterium]|nr:hypothetical protein [Gammaproteobacteria bacterium]
MRTLRLLTIGLLLLVLSSCMGFGYYQVTDTVNGTNYFTKGVKDTKSGAVSFTDANSGARVTLQNH